ncbi:GNAT family N-acetyltransferase [Tabrizicola sp. WMC-M-20]|nr:GNAT family N-acetyltransferase [Tabrizicola sp. WMC-M-20]
MSGLVVEPVARAEWPALSGRFADLGFEQSHSYGAAAARRIGGSVQYCALTVQGQPVAAASVRIKTVPGLGRGIAWIASGPLVRPDDAPAPEVVQLAGILTALRQELCDRQGHVLRLRLSGTSLLAPETVADAARDAGFAPTDRAPVYRSFIVSLDQDDATLMAGLHGKWRGHLRAALKSGLTLDRGAGPAHQARFMALFDRVQGTKGFERPDILPTFHFALLEGDYRFDILIAQKDGVDAAGIVIGGAGATCVYLFGATDSIGRDHRAGYFLAAQGFSRARAMGFGHYDMGGVDFAANPAVAEFKERTGGMPVLSEPWEAWSPGLTGRVVPALERLRTRFKRGR